MALILRTTNGAPLTWDQGDQNLIYLYSGSLYNPYSGSVTVTGSIHVSGSISVVGSIQASKALSLTSQSPLPSGLPVGSLAVSASNLFFYNGTGAQAGWAQVI
jgi:hypothetical protein